MNLRDQFIRPNGTRYNRSGEANRSTAGRLGRKALLLLGVFAFNAAVAGAEDSKQPPKSQTPAEVKELIRGRIVSLTPVLEERFGTKIDEEMGTLYGLVTEEGEVYPILREQRGRAFYQDERLRDRPMDLYVRRFEGGAFVQVLLVYRLKEGKRLALDYWCDVCSISMYWLQPCECCQGDIRLRELPVTRLPEFITSSEKDEDGKDEASAGDR